MDRKVFLGDEDGDVAVFEVSSELKLLQETAMNERITGTAIASGKVMYLATTNRIFAIEAKEGE
jgi:hypothetical protein